MSTAEVRVPLEAARRAADEIVGRLSPACERIEVAGSIRREAIDAGDVEIVAIPKTVFDRDPSVLFGEPIEMNLLLDLVQTLRIEGFLGAVEHRTADGERYTKAIHRGSMMQLDLFMVRPPAQWGVIFLIRTGPPEFSQWVVTEARRRHFHVADGALHRGSMKCASPPCEVVDTPEESDFLAALGIGYRPPNMRDDARWR